MTTPRHLLRVWDPSHEDDAMDRQLRVRLEWGRRWGAGEADAEDVYAGWVKLGSPERVEPLRHADDFLALQTQLDADPETSLCLTDSRPRVRGPLLANLSHRRRSRVPRLVRAKLRGGRW